MLIRASSMVKVSLLSDAATMPLHWIYNQDTILEKIGTHQFSAHDASFYPTPSCPYYSYPFGVYSPYGDESIPLFRSLACVGSYDCKDVASNMFNFFSAYPDKTPEKDYNGRLSHVPKVFVEARGSGKSWEECSSDDFQATGIAKVPLIVARYAGSPELIPTIESMVQILQKNQLSIECSVLVGLLLERILLQNESPVTAVAGLGIHPALNNFQRNVMTFINSDTKIHQWVLFIESLTSKDASKVSSVKWKLLLHWLHHYHQHHDLTSAIASSQAVLTEEEYVFVQSYEVETEAIVASEENAAFTPMRVAKALGLSCALPDALLNILYLLRKADNLLQAIHWNILMGGDNCSRALVLGAAYGASTGVVPEAWKNKLQSPLWLELEAAADKVS